MIMGNFTKVDLLSPTSKLSLGENEIDLVISGTKTPSHLVLNKSILDQVRKKGLFKMNVYQDASNKVLAFNFGKTGDITIIQNPNSDKRRNILKLTNKKLIAFICEFFGISPAIKAHNKLIISDNKANGSDILMFYVRVSGMEHVNFK